MKPEHATEARAFEGVPDYGFAHSGAAHTMAYLIPAIRSMVGPFTQGTRVLDVGCGNGYLANWFADQGCSVVGIDPSGSGMDQARKAYPRVRFEQLIADEHLLEKLAEPAFDLVVSTEVVEHLYSPRDWARGIRHCLRPGGRLVCTTPYHGYIKNIAIAVAGKYDSHHNPLWDGGHIKFWSPATLSRLLTECGYEGIRWRGAGRVPGLWMGLVMTGVRPS
jgi:2-polyprenyl-6-hydroxyphenyl methylase/3-demethylubiquinone-9 3-methyltransferase